MPACNRREFLQSSIATAIAGLTARSAAQSNDPFAGGVVVGTRPLSGRGAADTPIGTLLGRGLDARLFTDLSTLTPDTLITSNDRFYVRTSAPDRLDSSRPWTVTLGGLVRRPVTVTLDRLAQTPCQWARICSNAGNNTLEFRVDERGGMVRVPIAQPSTARAAGCPWWTDPRLRLRRSSLPSRSSTPGASWISAWTSLERAGAFLANRMNAASLPRITGSRCG